MVYRSNNRRVRRDIRYFLATAQELVKNPYNGMELEMKVLTVKRLDPGISRDEKRGATVDINLETICMVGDFWLPSMENKEAKMRTGACVVTLANGQVCAVEISRVELKKKMECK